MTIGYSFLCIYIVHVHVYNSNSDNWFRNHTVRSSYMDMFIVLLPLCIENKAQVFITLFYDAIGVLDL